MEAAWIALLIVLVILVIGGLIAWAVVHHLYVKSFEDKGWSYQGSGAITVVNGLNVAPFGMGFERSIGKHIAGTAADGTPFSAFQYRSSTFHGAGLVITMPLPHSMPALALTPGRGAVSAVDQRYAEVAAAALAPASTFGLTIDHAHLVLVGAPDTANELERTIAAMAAARTALLASPAASLTGPPPPPGMSFVEHPDWSYQAHNDSMLSYIGHTTSGYAHEAFDIITSDNNGLPFIRLRHVWKTDSTSTDSEGRSHTTTTTHTEYLCLFRMSFPFIDLGVNWGLLGRSQRFEWEAFNDAFRIESTTPRLAHAVIDQRQMQYLMDSHPPKFRLLPDGQIQLKIRLDWEPKDLVAVDRFLRGFFARVPDIVWQELGAWPRPIAELPPATHPS